MNEEYLRQEIKELMRRIYILEQIHNDDEIRKKEEELIENGYLDPDYLN